MSRELIDTLEAAFVAQADPIRAARACAYMRNQFRFYGITAPAQRLIAREVTSALPVPTERDLARVAKTCWRRPEREWQYFGCWYLRRHLPGRSAGMLAHVEPLITTKSWWDTVDTLASHAVGELVAQHPGLVPTMDTWIESDDIWLARTAILHQLRYKAQTDRARLFRYCARRADDREFFIRKAIGWALREYSKTDEVAVRAFVRRNAATLAPLSRKEALKWLERRV